MVSSDFSGVGSEFEFLKQMESAMQQQALFSGRENDKCAQKLFAVDCLL